MSWILKTERLRFRRLDERDLPPLTEMFADPDVMRFALDGVRDAAQTRAWFDGHAKRFPAAPWGFCAGIAKDDGAYVGHVGLLRQEIEGRTYTEVGYWLHPAHWGRGYATEGARAFRDHAFEELGEDEVISLIVPENEASQAVARRNGMTLREEVRWKNIPRVLRYSITREEWAAC